MIIDILVYIYSYILAILYSLNLAMTNIVDFVAFEASKKILSLKIS